MRRYETVIAFDTHFNDERIIQEVEKVKGLLSSNSAENINVDKWGRKELAHPVNNRSYGAYYAFSYDTNNNQLVEKLNSILRIDDGVLKFQSHKLGIPKRKFKGSISKQDD